MGKGKLVKMENSVWQRIQRASTRWVKGLKDFNYEGRLKALKLQSLEKRRVRNDLILTLKIIYTQINLEATQLFKFSKKARTKKVIT